MAAALAEERLRGAIMNVTDFRKDVDIIFVEGIDEREGDVAAAVMNRLRKAAEVEVKGS